METSSSSRATASRNCTESAYIPCEFLSIHPSYLLSSAGGGSQGSAEAFLSCHRVKAGWHTGQVRSSSRGHMSCISIPLRMVQSFFLASRKRWWKNSHTEEKKNLSVMAGRFLTLSWSGFSDVSILRYNEKVPWRQSSSHFTSSKRKIQQAFRTANCVEMQIYHHRFWLMWFCGMFPCAVCTFAPFLRRFCKTKNK